MGTKASLGGSPRQGLRLQYQRTNTDLYVLVLIKVLYFVLLVEEGI